MLEKITFFKKIFLQDEQRNASIAHAVLSEFDYVCWIDLETQGYILYYSADEKTVVPQHSAGNFDQVIGDFNLQYIVPEEAEADKSLLRADMGLTQEEWKKQLHSAARYKEIKALKQNGF